MKQKWTVQLEFVESEGENCPEPWYSHHDVANLIRRVLQRGPIRDLKFESIQVKPVGDHYY